MSDAGPDITDESVWRPLLRDVCAAAGLSDLGARPEFASNAAFLLDDAAVKIYPPGHEAEYATEKTVLESLGHADDVPVARLLGAGTLQRDGAWSYLVMDRVRGIPFPEARAAIPADGLRRLASEFGEAMRGFHSGAAAIRAGQSAAAGLASPTWDSLCRGRRDIFLRETDKIKSLPSDLVQALRQRAAGDPPDGERVLAHADLCGEHLIVEEKGGRWRLAGLIDVADALLAPADYDWVDLWFFTWERDVDCMRSFLDAYGSDGEAFRARCLDIFLCSFSAAGWLEHFLKQAGGPSVGTVAELRDFFWPPTLESRG